jgi:hypothetical protein
MNCLRGWLMPKTTSGVTDTLYMRFFGCWCHPRMDLCQAGGDNWVIRDESERQNDVPISQNFALSPVQFAGHRKYNLKGSVVAL